MQYNVMQNNTPQYNDLLYIYTYNVLTNTSIWQAAGMPPQSSGNYV